MPDRKLSFNITADDDASKVFEKISRTAKKEMGAVEDSLDDTRTAGKKAADALSAVFDELDAEMAQTTQAADRLAQAMGPELAGKVDASKAVNEFKRMGLTLEEIEADADELALALKKADDVSLKHFSGQADAAGASVKNLGDSSDQSRSVLANMVGNSTQDLGALGGVAGTAGMAIGQLGEYAAEGNISLQGLAKVAGPMALVTVAAGGIGAALKAIDAEKAFRADLVKKFTDAMKEGKSAAESMRDVVIETGKLDFESGLFGGGGIAGIGSKTRDLVPIFQDLGYETAEWLRFLDDPAGAADKFIATAEAMGTENIALQNKLIKAAEGLMQYADSAAEAEKVQALLNEIQTEATGVNAELINQLADMPGLTVRNTLATGDLADAADDSADAHLRQQDAIKAAREEAQRAADGIFDLEEAERALIDSVRTLAAETEANTLVQLDSKRTAEEKATSAYELRDAEIAAAKEAFNAAQAYAAEKGAAEGSAQSAQLQRQRLIELANQFPSLRDEIQQYIDKLLAIPTSRTTTINTITATGSNRNRGVAIASAAGGPVRAGDLHLVGEEGPELFVSNTNGTIIPNGGVAGVGSPAAVGSSPVVYNLTVNAGIGTNGRELGRAVVTAIKQYERYNGSGWRR